MYLIITTPDPPDPPVKPVLLWAAAPPPPVLSVPFISAGATNGDEIAVAGTVNTGGGGGAGSSNTAPYSIGGLGGSGVVYIRYRFQ